MKFSDWCLALAKASRSSYDATTDELNSVEYAHETHQHTDETVLTSSNEYHQCVKIGYLSTNIRNSCQNIPIDIFVAKQAPHWSELHVQELPESTKFALNLHIHSAYHLRSVVLII